jgi:hypothetical protein
LESYYANLIAYRVTANELVMEFGNFFAGQDDNRTKADHEDFDIRVVMNPDLIEPIINLLEQAKKARDEQRTNMETARRSIEKEEQHGKS